MATAGGWWASTDRQLSAAPLLAAPFNSLSQDAAGARRSRAAAPRPSGPFPGGGRSNPAGAAHLGGAGRIPKRRSGRSRVRLNSCCGGGAPAASTRGRHGRNKIDGEKNKNRRPKISSILPAPPQRAHAAPTHTRAPVPPSRNLSPGSKSASESARARRPFPRTRGTTDNVYIRIRGPGPAAAVRPGPTRPGPARRG